MLIIFLLLGCGTIGQHDGGPSLCGAVEPGSSLQRSNISYLTIIYGNSEKQGRVGIGRSGAAPRVGMFGRLLLLATRGMGTSSSLRAAVNGMGHVWAGRARVSHAWGGNAHLEEDQHERDVDDREFGREVQQPCKRRRSKASCDESCDESGEVQQPFKARIGNSMAQQRYQPISNERTETPSAARMCVRGRRLCKKKGEPQKRHQRGALVRVSTPVQGQRGAEDGWCTVGLNQAGQA